MNHIVKKVYIYMLTNGEGWLGDPKGARSTYMARINLEALMRQTQ